MTYIWRHVLYEHSSRPTRLDLSCPSCSSKIRFIKDSEKAHSFSGDCSGTWNLNDWRGTCTNCIKQFVNYSYEELPELFYKSKSTGIWAWNLEHLTHLLNYFQGIKDNSDYEYFDNYLRRKWLQNKSANIKALKELLNKSSNSHRTV